MEELLDIVGLELQILHCGRGRVKRSFVELAVFPAHRFIGGLEFTGGLAVRPKFLDANIFAVGILRARGLVKIFLLRESFDDFGRSQGGRSFRGRRALDAGDFVIGRRSERAGALFLGRER